jgi:hypothetical protein
MNGITALWISVADYRIRLFVDIKLVIFALACCISTQHISMRIALPGGRRLPG